VSDSKGAASLRVLSARWLLASPSDWSEGGGVAVQQGRIVRVLRGSGAVARALRSPGVIHEDLGEGVLTAGLVNAHAHLELSDLAGAMPSFEREREGDFASWIRTLLTHKRESAASPVESAVAHGARRLLETGTTCVGDIDSGAARACLRRGGPRVRQYREVLDVWNTERRKAALAGISRRLGRHSRIGEGLSPHAPYTVSDELLRQVARLRSRRSVPVSMHWAESLDEAAWSREGKSELAEMIPAAERRPGLERLKAAGLLGPWTSLVHANHATDPEVDLVARAGAVVVHCPGSHRFFGRAPFELERWRTRGVRLALGTDSLASNEDLDMRREMALFRRGHPGVAPADVWEMATSAGAQALGWGGALGDLQAGAWADLALHRVSTTAREPQLDELTGGMIPVRSVWIAGRVARSMEDG